MINLLVLSSLTCRNLFVRHRTIFDGVTENTRDYHLWVNQPALPLTTASRKCVDSGGHLQNAAPQKHTHIWALHSTSTVNNHTHESRVKKSTFRGELIKMLIHPPSFALGLIVM